ncbi:hypothetical protein [Roseovarius sp. EL26]|uniref:hypothetical protein n=1 Tax=Roseovarius sp. EL26 TaxID=2126672 RepID=UPI0013C51EB4|nr:hypothetical protein [Roseovarius sp. EL26]
MFHRVSLILLAGAFVPALNGSALAEDDSFFLMTGESLACVTSHRADYDIEDGNVAFIAVSECAGASGGGQVSILDQVLNSAPDVSVDETQGPDPVVALSKEDFECLTTLEIPENSDLYAFYPEGCRLEQR